MLNYITTLLLALSVIFLLIVSLDLEITNSSKFSFGQTSNFTVNNNNISSNNNSSTITAPIVVKLTQHHQQQLRIG